MELARVDYSLVGLTSPQCMKLLPNTAPKAVQKVSIDNDASQPRNYVFIIMYYSFVQYNFCKFMPIKRNDK